MVNTIQNNKDNTMAAKSRLKGRKGSVGKPVGEIQVKTNVAVQKQSEATGEKKVSSATLKRRAAQSPARQDESVIV